MKERERQKETAREERHSSLCGPASGAWLTAQPEPHMPSTAALMSKLLQRRAYLEKSQPS